ncbi:hypothetical protein E2704_16830 [Salmonella enterica]|nr:hypothetical protein DOE56_00205 [Salmonella enterica subsp. arizonae serovar 63:g,z51:-]EAA7631994.1 hypothetical protein [Salmonella enterica]EAN8610949.1 hypothetical protein [Salmonella enterica subsp. arizonae serovar 48:z4,z24:-]ECT1271368.1 hypothetical protein [Salmonella enterica subsp. houtenae serovar 48:g,z51:-]MIH89786.1 hypothetical protein [Salmonella enterica subsp. arizonae]
MKWNNTWRKDANARSVPERRQRHPAHERHDVNATSPSAPPVNDAASVNPASPAYAARNN